MIKEKSEALSFIESKEATIIDASHQVWNFAELSLKEFKSAKMYCEKLKEEGFEVEEGLCGIDTAFSGKFGSGRPYIGILGEFDALSGLSQKACATVRDELIPGESGHGCGHNMLGAASFGAALGIKKYLEQTGKSGTVIFFGCPGEEGGASKALMARENVWRDLDAALTWHPGDCNEVSSGSNNASIQILYKFKGIASHAAGSPEHGRSALDAVELMNTGVQYLREHVKSDARIHYAITNAGGASPNVVQPYADVLYMVRSPKVKEDVELVARVDKIALGASIMTDTTYERIFVDGTANTIPNSVLEKLLFKNMNEVSLPEYTEEEQAYAMELMNSYEKRNPLPGSGTKVDKQVAKAVRELSENGTKAINNFVIPHVSHEISSPGSTDVGDVSWETPTAQFNAVCWPSGTPGHSWQNVSSACSSLGDKGTMYAAKVLCGAAIDLFEDNSIIAEAKAEFDEKTEEGYTCPVPEGAKLYVIE